MEKHESEINPGESVVCFGDNCGEAEKIKDELRDATILNRAVESQKEIERKNQ